jgi:glycosyltransferase involved in cell wall biosynthesis
LSKPKILFILHLPPPVHGAAMVGQSIKLSQYINDAIEGEYINLTTASSIEEIGKKKIGKIINLFQIQLKVLKALLRNNYNLCYVSLNAKGPGFYKDLFVVILLKIFKKKIIYHFHNKGVIVNSKGWFNNCLYKYAFKNTKSILLSPNLYSDFKKYIRNEDVYYCPNGIHPGIGRKQYNSTINLKSKTQLLFLSNMIAEKGVFLIIEACKKLKDKEIDFECHFVGAWTDILEFDIQKLIFQFKLEHHVFLNGPKYGNEKKDFFLKADVFVFPTYYKNESFPLVLLEAMSYSLPVISTHEGGIPDIVIDNETGYLVPPNNIQELVSKIELLIKYPELREKFGNAGRLRFLEFYTIERFEKKFVEILDTVIKDNKF